MLVIGGAGYIGSAFVRKALAAGNGCSVYDDLSKGHRESIPLGKQHFFAGSILNTNYLKSIIRQTEPECILHFAALAEVKESVLHPERYYRNNVEGVRTLLEVLYELNYGGQLIFSSSCAVFGLPAHLPIRESDPKNPVSPYGRSKLMAEYMIEDYSRVVGFKSMALRYFNASGAYSLECGEDHEPETHLIPNVLKAGMTDQSVSIFGNDFPTPDGSCIRDYIHVDDLATAHLLAADFLGKQNPGFYDAIHLGTGSGISNLEIVRVCEGVLGREIQVNLAPRRPGDPPELYTDNKKAKDLLGFTPQVSQIENIVGSAYLWHNHHPNGYQKSLVNSAS